MRERERNPWHSFVGVTIFAVAVGLLVHQGYYSWAVGTVVAGIISEIRELR